MTDGIKIRSVSDGSAWGWGPTRIKKCLRVAVVAILSVVPIALAAAEKYQVYLSPMPFNDETQPNMTGKGTASATLDGETLSITGTFTGLASAATKAHLSLSRGPGIPGTAIFDLVVSPGVAGKLTGKVKLQPNQIAAVTSGKLYLQIDTERVPTGTLWGWLLPEHEVAGQNVPQRGSWYIPPFAVRTK